MTEPLPPLNAIALSPNNQHIVLNSFLGQIFFYQAFEIV